MPQFFFEIDQVDSSCGHKNLIVIGLFRWSGGGCFTTPLTFRLFATCSVHSAGPLWRRGRYSDVLEERYLVKEVVVRVFHLLSFTGCVFSILLCLLSLAVKQGFLLR